ncbi:DUF4241 domain-containing protein [Kitasatospora sp. NPDC101183]|uniref:DUF4241 domain-containing protein n=1 Tax=Kitasatospora sp. NPDC101183 TaxID=3364100 RepID=UPI003808D867
MPLPAPDVERLFTLGSRYVSSRGETATVIALPTAELPLPSGTVSACDPYVSLEEQEDEPFPQTAPPGTHPVTLSVVEFAGPDDPRYHPDRRVAAAHLRLREEPAVRWALADGDEEEQQALGDHEYLGYAVDAGTGCFHDAAAREALYAHFGDADVLEAAFDALADTDPCRLGPVRFTDPATGAGLVAFRSGRGDGLYPTWAGYGADGQPVALITEFLIVPQPGRTYED